MNEYKCNACDGTGILSIVKYMDGEEVNSCETRCFRCRGSGTVDWVTNITNNKKISDDIWMKDVSPFWRIKQKGNE